MLTQERYGTINPYTLNQGELEQWAAWNVSDIGRNLAGVERNLQDALAGRDKDLLARNPNKDVRPTGEVFYVPRNTESSLATGIIIPAGLGVLDLEFAEKDWSRGEATRVYNPLTDSLAVTVLYDS
ncbi:MAG TPA: hypothetical protein VD735_01600, partial [Candidatus Saccharimonadales bacterium]|nr:hypothetical protein [Candidatus Saccharimonadales bacterium]